MSALAGLALLAAAPAPAQAQSRAQAQAPSSPDLPAVEASLIAPALRVADCERARRFYEQALGARVLMSRDLAHVHETMLALGGQPGRPGIMLLCAAKPGAPAPAPGRSRLIVRVDDMDALVVRLDAAGIAHQPPAMPANGVKVLNLADPDGHEIELVQTPAGHRKDRG